MQMTLTTPALLFPAISLLMLAYTNRFLVLAGLVRELHRRKSTEAHEFVQPQIDNLENRISLIKAMQICGTISFILCTLSMFALFLNLVIVGEVLFGSSLILLLGSLFLSLVELMKSTDALKVQLSDMSEKK